MSDIFNTPYDAVAQQEKRRRENEIKRIQSMTNLTFAIEAAKRGCPYVVFGRRGELIATFWDGHPPLERLNHTRSYVFGATLALWLDEKAVETEEQYKAMVSRDEVTVEHQNYRNEIESLRFWAHLSRSFAKGL